jgi:hypothetical protein
MLRHFKRLTVRAGLVVLILLASVPEVRCCCDVSWGPAGLVGNRALCSANLNSQPHSDCCCVHEQEKSAPPGDGCRDEDCDCQFTVVCPAPMAVGSHSDAVPAPCREVWNQVSPSLILGPRFVSRNVDEQPDSVPRPAERCALLQRWLA